MVSFTSGEMKHQNNRSSDQYDLHSIHKSTASRINKPTAGPQQPKVYKVKPIHFRELVQQLTGAGASLQLQHHQSEPQPQPQYRRSTLQSVAPPPLPLHPHQLRVQNQTHTSIMKQEVQCKVEQALPAAPVEEKPLLDKIEGGDDLTELTLSPNFRAWFSFAMLSPGPATVSQLEQRSVV